MSANLFMIYQINDLEKSRDYRCRPYEYQIENSFMVTSENYVLGYKASLIQGVTPGQIRERMEKLNPDRFRVRKFGVSDVIVTSIGGKTQSYYVNPKELIKFNGFFTKLPNGEYLLLNEEGYQVEGQKGTWTVTDEKTIDEQRFVLMVSDQKPDLLPSIVVQSDGKFMTTTSSGFDNATVRKVRELLHHEKFLENGTAERARESGTEQNYNMIDGCVNNVPKKPRVIGGRGSGSPAYQTGGKSAKGQCAGSAAGTNTKNLKLQKCVIRVKFFKHGIAELIF